MLLMSDTTKKLCTDHKPGTNSSLNLTHLNDTTTQCIPHLFKTLLMKLLLLFSSDFFSWSFVED